MSGNILIRNAKKNYVCDCCGHIIRAGSEYLDKVTLNDGKCVRHERYHDECPSTNSMEALMKLIVKWNGDLIVSHNTGCSLSGEKIHVNGIAYAHDDWYVLYHNWDDPEQGKYMTLQELIKNYHDDSGQRIV